MAEQEQFVSINLWDTRENDEQKPDVHIAGYPVRMRDDGFLEEDTSSTVWSYTLPEQFQIPGLACDEWYTFQELEKKFPDIHAWLRKEAIDHWNETHEDGDDEIADGYLDVENVCQCCGVEH